MNSEFPHFISFGEALTDMIRLDADRWTSVPGGAPWNVAQVMACFGVPSAFGGAQIPMGACVELELVAELA